MADPARTPDPRDPMTPAGMDPLNPRPSAADPRLNPANTERPGITNRVESRSGGSGVMIAAVVLVLAIIAYFVFAPGTRDTVVAPESPAVTTEPATPTPAPDATAPAAPGATAPAAPADTTAPAPDASAPAPAETAPAPATPAPAAPAQ